MIQAKIEGKQTVEPPEEAHLAPVIDIMEALKMSLENAKKPVRTATGKAAIESDAPAKPKKAKKA
jgi:DNA end-binding protein Ku